MPLDDAIRATKDGTIIDFDVSPGARGTVVPSGYNPWRRRVEAKLKAPPMKGRANEELIEALSTLFDVPSASIEITSGATDSRKSVRVSGLTVADAIRVLGARL